MGTPHKLGLLEELMAQYHKEVWQAAEGGSDQSRQVDYDMAGLDTAKSMVHIIQEAIQVIESLERELEEFKSKSIPLSVPNGMNTHTSALVGSFGQALMDKLYDAQVKYDRGSSWRDKGWMDECRKELVVHLDKGDPRDVAAYCAFLWAHGESTKIDVGPGGVLQLIARAQAKNAPPQSEATPTRLEPTPVAQLDGVDIDPTEVVIENIRDPEAGSFSIAPATGIRLTHKPTGVVVTSTEERSQHRNRLVAFQLLQAELLKRKNDPKAAKNPPFDVDALEEAYWLFDAMVKGYPPHTKTNERMAFKAAVAAIVKPSTDPTAPFHGYDPEKLPAILISLVAKMWPGSGGMFWERRLDHLATRFQEIKDAYDSVPTVKFVQGLRDLAKEGWEVTLRREGVFYHLNVRREDTEKTYTDSCISGIVVSFVKDMES